MHWKKLGQIFDPSEHNLLNNCRAYAQSPQAVVFDDFVRIYFSTRQVDGTGKYLSQIAFVDFEPDLKSVRAVSQAPVLPLGELGCFDEHGIFPINPVRQGRRILAYTCGWSRRVSVPVETGIGLAVSEDEGLTFQRVGTGPVLTTSLHEPFLVGDPFVQIQAGVYHMWYIYGTNWSATEKDGTPARLYKIGHASSSNGIDWVKDGRQLIPDRLNPEECQALPSVAGFGGAYHMFFCYRQATDFRKNPARSYRIGYARSTDLIEWTRMDEQAGIDVSESGWDSQMLCYPHVFLYTGKVYLLYNGNDFGRSGFGLAVLED